MSRYSEIVKDERGYAIPGVSVYVYEWDQPSQTTGALSDLTDDDLTTPLANPLTTDEFGQFYFNASNGVKLIEYHYAGKLIYREQVILTPAGNYPGNDAALRDDLVATDGGSLVTFSQSGGVDRTVQDKLRDVVSVKDFGAVGDGTTGDGPALAIASAQNGLIFPAGVYKNATTALTFGFTTTARFMPGAALALSGSGSATFNGVTIREGYNPSTLASWTGSAAYSYEGLSVDLGGYGPRAFGPNGTPTALNGSINIPSTATTSPHANGVSGYAKSASPSTGAVALYGEANRLAANVGAWGLNTRTQDAGFGGLTVWGYEVDLNIDNVSTIAVGVEATGGSTVQPTLSVAFQCSAIGIFATPKKPWTIGFRTRDAGATIGMQIGALTETNNAASQPILLLYRDGSGVNQTGMTLQANGTGGGRIDAAMGISLQFNGVTVASTVTGGLDLASTKVLSVNAVQVVGARRTGWAVDTGTAKRTANATYGAGATLTYSGTYVQAEHTAMATRMAAVEAALQNATQTIKALKDDLHATAGHGLIGT